MPELKNEVQAEKNQKTDKFPCKACGGNMVFEPETNSLSCKYCNNKIEMTKDASQIKEYNLEDGLKNIVEDWGSATRVIKCNGCGAETVLGASDTAKFCAFCGSSHVINNDKTAGIVPESLIPFKIPEKGAKEMFSKWIKKRYLAPSALKSSLQAERMKGVYIPGWTYDSETSSTYSGEGGTYYYVTETRWVTENGKQVQKSQQVRKIRWWPTSGSYSEFFDDVPVNASKQVDNGLMGKLEPFDRQELVPYKAEYLSGFLAERYSVELKEGWETAILKIDAEIRKGVVNQINADEVRNLHINTFYNNIKYKLTLLPIWISSYSYKNKSYTFMINGQTGKVSGRSPLSLIKILLLSGLGIALIILGYLIYQKVK